MKAMALLASLLGKQSGEPKVNIFLEFHTSRSTPKKFPKVAWFRTVEAFSKHSRMEGELQYVGPKIRKEGFG